MIQEWRDNPWLHINPASSGLMNTETKALSGQVHSFRSTARTYILSCGTTGSVWFNQGVAVLSGGLMVKRPIWHQKRKTLPKGICCSLFFTSAWPFHCSESPRTGTSGRTKVLEGKIWHCFQRLHEKLSWFQDETHSLRSIKPGLMWAGPGWGLVSASFGLLYHPTFYFVSTGSQWHSLLSPYTASAMMKLCCDAFDIQRCMISSLEGFDTFCSMWKRQSEAMRYPNEQLSWGITTASPKENVYFVIQNYSLFIFPPTFCLNVQLLLHLFCDYSELVWFGPT